MNSISLILMAMFTTLNTVTPGGQISDPGLAQSQLHFLVVAAAMAVTAAYMAVPRRRKAVKGSVLRGAKAYNASKLGATR